MKPLVDLIREFVSTEPPADVAVELSAEEILAMYPQLAIDYAASAGTEDEYTETEVWEHLCSEADRGHFRRGGPIS